MIDRPTFARLFETWHPRLYAYVRSRVADQNTAEDITATAFERAFRSSHSFDPDKGTFDAWLFRIARNLIISHYRAESRRPGTTALDQALPVASAATSPEQRLLQQNLYDRLEETLQTVSERDQEIIRLRFFGQLTNRKIAEVMDMNEKTVSVVIYRTLKKLKTRLKAKER